MAATTHLGSRVLGRVEAGHSSEGPVGPLHIGGQLIGGGRRGGLGDRALLSGARTAAGPQPPLPHRTAAPHTLWARALTEQGSSLPLGAGEPLAQA